MVQTMIDFTREREAMIERHLRRRGINEKAIIDAFLAVPREAFVSPEYAHLAYGDHPLPIEAGQTMAPDAGLSAPELLTPGALEQGPSTAEVAEAPVAQVAAAEAGSATTTSPGDSGLARSGRATRAARARRQPTIQASLPTDEPASGDGSTSVVERPLGSGETAAAESPAMTAEESAEERGTVIPLGGPEAASEPPVPLGGPEATSEPPVPLEEPTPPAVSPDDSTLPGPSRGAAAAARSLRRIAVRLRRAAMA